MIEGLRLWLAGTNAWIVAPAGPGGECVLIDAPPDPRVILNRLREQGLKLVALLTTHGHVDHVGGIGEVVAHAHDGMVAPGRSRPDPVPVHLHDADRHMLLDPLASGGTLAQMLDLESLRLPPPEIVFGLDDGQKVSGAGMTFTALHTPGHTQGSVCFLLEMEGEAPMLFSGDHLFAGSIGRTDLPGGSYEQLMVSMAEKILPLPDDVVVFPGHGGTTTIGQERRTNPFLLREFGGEGAVTTS
ncbi:MAG: hydroxyacylglutathione hydrolase [Actinomycetota bacterium]|nr:hydroxyacylglutathione hydrolase [Actinomycetota bacterium]